MKSPFGQLEKYELCTQGETAQKKINSCTMRRKKIDGHATCEFPAKRKKINQVSSSLNFWILFCANSQCIFIPRKWNPAKGPPRVLSGSAGWPRSSLGERWRSCCRNWRRSSRWPQRSNSAPRIIFEFVSWHFDALRPPTREEGFLGGRPYIEEGKTEETATKVEKDKLKNTTIKTFF